jgi:hypothetical protein
MMLRRSCNEFLLKRMVLNTRRNWGFGNGVLYLLGAHGIECPFYGVWKL